MATLIRHERADDGGGDMLDVVLAHTTNTTANLEEDSNSLQLSLNLSLNASANFQLDNTNNNDESEGASIADATHSTTDSKSKASSRGTRTSVYSGYSGFSNRTGGGMSSRRRSNESTTKAPESASGLTKEARKRLDDLEINKLRFHQLGLVGREKEVQQVYDVMDHWNDSRSLLLIGGGAGAGKSRLALHTLSPLVEKESGFLLMGKFDQQQSDKPYAAIASCCDDFCEQVIANFSTTQIMDLKAQLRKEIGPEGETLTSIIPSLLPFIGAHENDDIDDHDNHSQHHAHHHESSSIHPSKHQSDGYLNAKLKFNTAFRRFMRVACKLAPTVLLIDDLQWCDESSFQLMESLLKDFENTRLLIVGTFRPDEITDGHLLLKFRHQFEASSSTDQLAKKNVSFRIQNKVHARCILLDNLSLSATNDMLVELLGMSPTAVQDLAQLVHNKTLGNAFFTVQFLTSLQHRKLLEYNFGKLCWTWDLQKIDDSTLATENVADLMNAKLEGLSAELRYLLPLMGSLGASFTQPLFRMVMNHVQAQEARLQQQAKLQAATTTTTQTTTTSTTTTTTTTATTDTAQEAAVYSEYTSKDDDVRVLAVCVEEGLLERQGRQTYRWIHDKVQEGALSLVPLVRLVQLQFDLALSLLDQMNEAEVDEHVFVLVHLLRTADAKLRPDDAKRLVIARLRLTSGLQAFRGSAFFQAAVELEAGIELLPKGSWEQDYQLCLELYSTAAEAHLCIGEIDAMNGYIDEILKQTEKKPLLDRKRAYDAKARGFMANGQPKETGEFLVKVLAKVGVKFPGLVGGIAQILWKLTKAQKNAQEITTKLATLPPVDDDTKEWTISLLAYLAAAWYYTQNPLMPLAVFKGFEISLKAGISSVSPETVAMVGLLCTVGLHDPNAGKLYADCAMDLLANMEAKTTEAKAIFITQDFVLHFTKPIEPCKKELLRGYYSGMANGDSEYGCWNICAFIEQSLITGTVLDSLINDCREYVLEAQELQQLPIASVTMLVWQMCLNWAGMSENPLILTGEAMDEEEWSKFTVGFSDTWHVQIGRYKIHTATVMGDYRYATELILKYKVPQGAVEKQLPGLFSVCWLYFHCAIALVSMARQTKRKSKYYRKLAKKFAKQIKTWAEQGSPNVTHHSALIQAELNDLEGKYDEADKLFQTSLLLSARRGFRQDRALAHERFGDFFVRQGDAASAKHHYNEALMTYTDWGAAAKVDQLRRAHQDMFSVPFEINADDDASDISGNSA